MTFAPAGPLRQDYGGADARTGEIRFDKHRDPPRKAFSVGTIRNGDIQLTQGTR